MKSMTLHLLLMVLYIFPHCCCKTTEDCINAGGEKLFPIYNSPYTILPNGSLCCPLFAGDFCKTEKEVQTKCPNGLVYEPCHFCKTCAKQAGESCGGLQNAYGRCDEGYHCVSENDTTPGTCYRNATKQLGEACGGSYGVNGTCLLGLRCNISHNRYLAGEKSLGVCLSAKAAAVCFKDCAERDRSMVCGDDGRWYNNKCYLRQQNCIIPEGRRPQRIKYNKENTTCENACGDVVDTDSSPLSKYATISYSNGVVNGSKATVMCNEGYQLLGGRESKTLLCTDKKWKNVVEEDGIEVLRDTWSIICIQSSRRQHDPDPSE